MDKIDFFLIKIHHHTFIKMNADIFKTLLYRGKYFMKQVGETNLSTEQIRYLDRFIQDIKTKVDVIIKNTTYIKDLYYKSTGFYYINLRPDDGDGGSPYYDISNNVLKRIDDFYYEYSNTINYKYDKILSKLSELDDIYYKVRLFFTKYSNELYSILRRIYIINTLENDYDTQNFLNEFMEQLNNTYSELNTDMTKIQKFENEIISYESLLEEYRYTF